MDRRGFLRTLIGGVAAGAAVRVFPFRVFSFPSEMVPSFPPLLAPGLATIYYSKEAVDALKANLLFDAIGSPPEFPLKFKGVQYQLVG